MEGLVQQFCPLQWHIPPKGWSRRGTRPTGRSYDRDLELSITLRTLLSYILLEPLVNLRFTRGSYLVPILHWLKMMLSFFPLSLFLEANFNRIENYTPLFPVIWNTHLFYGKPFPSKSSTLYKCEAVMQNQL